MSIITKANKLSTWNAVRRLRARGLKKTQIAFELNIHRHTVAKYLEMSLNEFLASESYERKYEHKLAAYEAFISEELRVFPYLSSPQIHRRLIDEFPDLPEVSSKTVYNYVQRIRAEHNIPYPRRTQGKRKHEESE